MIGSAEECDGLYLLRNQYLENKQAQELNSDSVFVSVSVSDEIILWHYRLSN